MGEPMESKKKVKDHFPERRKKHEEKVEALIKPQVVKETHEPENESTQIIDEKHEDISQEPMESKKKVKDHFAERKKKHEEEVKTLIKPKVVKETPELENESTQIIDEKQDIPQEPMESKKKVKDNFPERKKKHEEEVKTLIKPQVVKETHEPENESAQNIDEKQEDIPQEPMESKKKVKDHFPERRKKHEEKVEALIKPKVVKETHELENESTQIIDEKQDIPQEPMESKK